jgi:hypothetical protein
VAHRVEERLMRPVRSLAALAILALMLAPVPALGTDLAPTTEHLYIHNGAADCVDEGQQFLEYQKPTSGASCGFIYGLPMNEVEYNTGQGIFGPREYATQEGFGIVLDATRDLTGKIVVFSRTSVCPSPAPPPVPCADTGQGTGVGEVIVDLVATGETANFDSVALGTAQVTTLVTPGTVNYELPFTINLPDSIDQSALSTVKLSVFPRGKHLHTGYADAAGLSFIDVPSLTPAPAPAP